jgi:uncharacterized protein with gpF-like domain
MTNEEWERKMEFILEQQAQFYANIELMRERTGEHEKGMEEFRKGMEELRAAQQVTEMRLADMVGAQAQAARAQSHMFEVVAAMSDSQVRTDERLNSLINVFERHLIEGRNGNPKSE